jgi:hypothetical protein
MVISIVDTGLGQRSVSEDIEAEKDGFLPAHTICELGLEAAFPQGLTSDSGLRIDTPCYCGHCLQQLV